MASLADFVSMMRTGSMWQAAGCTVVFYDHITSFDREIELIWFRKWSSVNVLYLLNRYVGDAMFVHGSYRVWASGKVLDEICPSVFQVQSWLGMFAVFAMNGIIIKRIVCMYGNSKKVLWTLVTALAILAIYSTGLTVLLSKSPTLVIRVPSTYGYDVCVPDGETEQWYWSFLCFTLAFETLVFGLALYRGILLIRERNRAQWHREAITAIGRVWLMRGDFVGVLVRDSILFPLIGVLIQFFSILAWTKVLPAVGFQIIIVIAATAGPTLGCRLILNLREAYYKPFNVEYDQSQAEDSLVMPSLGDSSSGVWSTPRVPMQLQARRRSFGAEVNDP